MRIDSASTRSKLMLVVLGTRLVVSPLTIVPGTLARFRFLVGFAARSRVRFPPRVSAWPNQLPHQAQRCQLADCVPVARPSAVPRDGSPGESTMPQRPWAR